MRKTRLATVIAATITAAVILAGCAGSTKTVTNTVTQTVTVTASPSATLASSASATPDAGSPVLKGTDTSGVACSTLSAAEIAAATHNSVKSILGVPNPLNHSDTCTWFLGDLPSCSCGRVSVTIVWNQNAEHDSGFRTLWNTEIAGHTAIRIPGIKDSELDTTTTGLATSSSFLKQGLWVTVEARMAYTWSASNKPVLLALDSLVYQRAHAGKG